MIDSRLGELREQVRRAETRVDEFRKANRILTSEGGTVGEQQLTRINSELINARTQAAEAKARLDEVTAAARDAVRHVVAAGAGISVGGRNAVEGSRAGEGLGGVGQRSAGAFRQRASPTILLGPVGRKE